MPAEWARHAATQLIWPHNRSTWPGSRLKKVERVFAEIIATLSQYEPVYVCVASEQIKIRAQKRLKQSVRSLHSESVHWIEISNNDCWTRDCGPIFVYDSDQEQFVITDWRFNAWGEKYPPFDADDALPKQIATYLDLECISIDMVLEGGSIEINEQGDLITSESVLLNPNRNPHLSKNEIEGHLKTYLGVENIIWLGEGLVGDDTDGHVDDTARFLDNETILCVRCTDPTDPNYDTLEENYRRLKLAKSVTGNTFNIEWLPLPHNQTRQPTVDGSRYVPASYANYYVCNGAVLVPTYDPETDEQALDLLGQYFPDRDIIGIPCADLVWGQGSIHCVTQQWYGV
jgi:agmatine deiminase